MISVILYGRNDSHGYNLHKRAALSLNCIAALLDRPDDEILFVDYNTPDDFPSFPEAIADTLTPRARALLRVLRVRPAQHRRFAARSHLPALEPVARNVALRRANPANRWVLSTNTDMIFVPRAGRTLSGLAAELPDGSWHLPRMELPETLWESLDRRDPEGCIERAREWGARLHLNEYVLSPHGSIRFDGPGDFQLMLREDLFAIDGFDEEMLLGWHVDFNIAQRLALLRGPTGTLEEAFLGYHCEHTRQVTPAHRAGSVENDLRRFALDVRAARLPGQAESWGLAGEAVEEIRLDDGAGRYAAALAGAIGAPQEAPSRLMVSEQSYDRIGYDPRHVLPFLLDPLASHPPGTVLGWFAAAPGLLALAAAAWAGLGRGGPILVAAGAAWLGPLPEGARWAEAGEIAARADVLVFDFALPDGREDMAPEGPVDLPPPLDFVMRGLRRMARAEEKRTASGLPPRRFMAVNCIHNRCEPMVARLIGAARSPMAMRLRQGVALARPRAEMALQERLIVGAAGRAGADGAIWLRPWVRGHALFGPYADVPPGRWRLELTYRPAGGVRLPGPLRLEALAGERVFARRTLWLDGLLRRRLALEFEIPADQDEVLAERFEVRVSTPGMLRGCLDGARLLPL